MPLETVASEVVGGVRKTPYAPAREVSTGWRRMSAGLDEPGEKGGVRRAYGETFPSAVAYLTPRTVPVTGPRERRSGTPERRVAHFPGPSLNGEKPPIMYLM